MATNLLNPRGLHQLACYTQAVRHWPSRVFIALALVIFSVSAFSAIEQVPPSSPAQSIPAQTGIEAVSPSSSDWIAYYGGYSYGGYHSSAAIACAAFNDGSTGYPSSYTKFVFAGTTANLYIGFPYLDCLSTTVIISALPPSIPPPSSTPIRNGSVKLIFVCPVPVINPVVPYTYNQSTSLCERAAANLCPSATPPYTRNSTTNRCERPAVCPAPATYPEIPYIYNLTNRMCERTVPDKLTITLSGGSTTEPSTSLPFKAIVTDQAYQRKANIPVIIRSKVKAQSGGHDHDYDDARRPPGSLTGVACAAPPGTGLCVSGVTDSNGEVEFKFSAPQSAGIHYLTATCSECAYPAPPEEITVKVAGLVQIPGSPYYVFVGATNQHSDNHYLTPEAESVLKRMAVAYRSESRFRISGVAPPTFGTGGYRRFKSRLFKSRFKTGGVAPLPLHLNDASLMWGGVFDLDADWDVPHGEHMRGVVVDIRANAATGAIASGNFEEFKKLAIFYGADAGIHSPGAANQHFHVRLLNRSE